ncbi:MAG: TetR/AcrR family transcriptional regulator [Sciscionella sp.]
MKNPALLEERRTHLVEAATEVFFQRGFDRATVNEIAERCGWSVGGLYRYVRRKDDILYLVCAEIYRKIGRDALGTTNLPSPDPAQRFTAAFTAYCANIQCHRRQVLLMYREYGRLSPDAQQYFMHIEADLRDAFREIVDDGVTHGIFVCEDPELFATDCVMRAHTLALKGWALQSRPLNDTAAKLVTWTLRSLSAPTRTNT